MGKAMNWMREASYNIGKHLSFGAIDQTHSLSPREKRRKQEHNLVKGLNRTVQNSRNLTVYPSTSLLDG